MLLLRISNETSRVVGFSRKGEINFSRCPYTDLKPYIAVFAGVRHIETPVTLIQQEFCCTSSDWEPL
jgi:hypothetical protein